LQAKNRETGEIVALKRVRLDDDDEGVPSSALREICLLKVRLSNNLLKGLCHSVLWIRNYFFRIRIPFAAEFWIRIQKNSYLYGSGS
jgi:hypothetical protein